MYAPTAAQLGFDILVHKFHMWRLKINNKPNYKEISNSSKNTPMTQDNYKPYTITLRTKQDHKTHTATVTTRYGKYFTESLGAIKLL